MGVQNGCPKFEDGLGLDDFVAGYSYHMSDRTGLPDQTKQIKFQSQRPSDVKTPVPSILSTEVKNKNFKLKIVKKCVQLLRPACYQK
jgi:hypothetical protein